jgi:hypothetical protein
VILRTRLSVLSLEARDNPSDVGLPIDPDAPPPPPEDDPALLGDPTPPGNPDDGVIPVVEPVGDNSSDPDPGDGPLGGDDSTEEVDFLPPPIIVTP